MGVTDLLCQVYGYSYRGLGPAGYDGETLGRALTDGQIEGTVACTPTGRVVAALCRRFVRPGEVELLELAVNCEFDRHKLDERLWEDARARADAQGLKKLIVSLGTRAKRAQQTAQRFDALPCVLEVGLHPGSLGVRSLDEEAPLHRSNFLLCAAVLDRRERAVTLPGAHRDLLWGLYDAHGLRRREQPPVRGPLALPARGELDIDLKAEWLRARLRVVHPGQDTLSRLQEVIDDLRRGYIEQIELRLPLDTGYAAKVCPELELLGFRVAGLEPAVAGRDELSLIWAEPGRVDLTGLALAHEAARALAKRLSAPTAPARLRRGPRPRERRERSSGAENPIAARARPARPSVTAEGRARVPQTPEALQHGRLQAARQLAAGLCHEINNPLNIIAGSLYALRARQNTQSLDAQAAAATLEAVSDIEDQVHRVARILRELQQFVDVGSRETDRSFCPREVAERAVRLAAGVFARRGMACTIESDEGIPLVAGRAGEVEEALLQLLLNAAEAGGDRAALTVRTIRGPAGRAKGVAFAVADTGRGMDSTTLARALEPFFTSKDTGHGVGLGLAMAASIAEAHQGTLRLESAPGEGTLAELRLRVPREAEGPDAPDRSGSGSHRSASSSQRIKGVKP
jgi:signal transduction histidine kinase